MSIAYQADVFSNCRSYDLTKRFWQNTCTAFCFLFLGEEENKIAVNVNISTKTLIVS